MATHSHALRLKQIQFPSGKLNRADVSIQEEQVEIRISDPNAVSEVKADGSSVKSVPAQPASVNLHPVGVPKRTQSQELYTAFDLIGFDNAPVVETLVAKAGKELKEILNDRNTLKLMDLMTKTILIVMKDVETIPQLQKQGKHKKMLVSHVVTCAIDNIARSFNLPPEAIDALKECAGSLIENIVDGLATVLNLVSKKMKESCGCF